MTFGSVISILLVGCLVGPVLSQQDRQSTVDAGDSPSPRARPPIPLSAPPPPSNSCRGGFSVRKAETRSLRARQKLQFQDVLTNMGGWSASANDFQAPCSGVYFFTFHAVSPENGDFTLALMRDGQYQVTAYGSKGDYQQGSNSALLVLNQGDRVHLELQDGSIYEHPYNEAYTTFTGYLVEEF